MMVCSLECEDRRRSLSGHSASTCDGSVGRIVKENRAANNRQASRRPVNPAGVDALEEEGLNSTQPARSGLLGWNKHFSSGGCNYCMRPIRPSDIEHYPAFLDRISAHDIKQRFLVARKTFSSLELRRITQIDHDREIAFVVFEAEHEDLAGVGRLCWDPAVGTGECALLVRTDLQGKGIGSLLLRQIVAYAKLKTIGRIEGIVLEENLTMLDLCRKFGFRIVPHPHELGLRVVALNLD